MITDVKYPEWEPLPGEGVVDVEGKVFLDEPGIGLAMLRFRPRASIPDHASETDCWVVCVEGRGFTRVGDAEEEIRAGQKVFWPKGIRHGLWTADREMTTLMVHPLGFTA